MYPSNLINSDKSSMTILGICRTLTHDLRDTYTKNKENQYKKSYKTQNLRGSSNMNYVLSRCSNFTI